MRRIHLVLLILMVLCIPAVAVGAQDTLNIYGDGFMFKVAEPTGMPGHTSDAGRYRLNAYFSPPGYSFNNAPAVMYIRVLTKDGLGVEKHLEADMEDFQRNYPVKYFDFEIKNLEYKYAAKKYLIDNRDADYLCYIDPGDGIPFYIIFVLSAQKEISDNYLSEFQKLTQSFVWLGNGVGK